MRTFEQVIATARPGIAFSNGTEYEIFDANWCDKCIHDAVYRRDGAAGEGCPILAVALMEPVTPAEWREQYPFGRYVCAEFVEE